MTDKPRPVLMRPEPGESKEEFVDRLIAAMRASGIPVKESDDE